MRLLAVALMVTMLGCSNSTPSATISTGQPPIPSSTTNTTSTASTTSTSEQVVTGAVVVVMPSGLPEAFVEEVSAIDGVGEVAIIRSGSMQLVASATADGDVVDAPPSGFVIPIEATVFGTAAAAEIFSPDLADVLARIGPEDVLLSESSAALRGLSVDSTMRFDDGSTFRVGAVTPDSVAGTTEAIFVGATAESLPPARPFIPSCSIA